jgi:hypothetical protein
MQKKTFKPFFLIFLILETQTKDVDGSEATIGECLFMARAGGKPERRIALHTIRGGKLH